MRSSCVLQPEKESLIIIREWQVNFCKGNQCAAALLSFFTYWHDIKLESRAKNIKENQIRERNGDPTKLPTTLHQFHSEEELEAGIMGIWKRDSIRKGLKDLEEIGVLEITKNPNPKYAFDKTRYFILHPEVANKYLMNRNFEDAKTENRTRSSENPSPLAENPLTITETTSDITHRDVLSYFFDLNSLETDASVREAFENADQFLKDGKYLGLVQSKDGNTPMLCVNLPTFKPVYIVSIESLWKLSFEQIAVLIKPLNNVSHLWPFKGYYVKFDDVRIRKGDELATAAGMGETPQPNADMKKLFNL